MKLQILRLLATLRLDPKRMDLIAGFMENYLTLTAKEELAFRRELGKLDESQQKALVMELMTSWERKGRQEGRQQGLEQGWQDSHLALVKRLLQRRLGALSPATVKRVSALSTERLEQLAEALLDFSGVADLQRWLARRDR